MKTFTCRYLVPGILIAALLPVAAAHAQLGDILKQGERAGSAGGTGGLGGLGSVLPGQSLAAGSTGNVAGVLEFCVKNNYLKGDAASGVKDKLMGKLPGGAPASDSGYSDGAKGLLNSSDGKQLDLSGGGAQAELTRQICDKVLAQGKSML